MMSLVLGTLLAVAAPTPSKALSDILPAEQHGVVAGLRLPGMPRPGPGMSFHAKKAPGSSARVLVAELTARLRGEVLFVRRVSIPLRTRIEVPVATRDIARGTVLSEGHFDLRRAHVPSPPLVVQSMDELLGREARRPIEAGQPVPRRSVEPRAIVERGDTVDVTFLGHGFRITMKARALEAGAQGDEIRVINAQSNAVVMARVVGPDRLEVGR